MVLGEGHICSLDRLTLNSQRPCAGIKVATMLFVCFLTLLLLLIIIIITCMYMMGCRAPTCMMTVWSLEDTFVELGLSLPLCVGSGDQIGVIKLLQQVLAHRALSLDTCPAS